MNRIMNEHPLPSWVLVGSEGLWGAECLTPGCLWVATRPTPETADTAALEHSWTCCRTTEGRYRL
jgi:hypothetical protein